MKFFNTLVVFIISITIANASPWENLFNNKNLDGWKVINGTAEYMVVDGAIVGISKEGTPNTFLITHNEYDNFILEYEMKMDANLNSGVQFRSNSRQDYMNGRFHGYQVECDDSERRWTGGIYDEARHKWLYSLEYNPPAKKAFKNQEWNHFRVEAIGTRIRTFVNGVPIADLLADYDNTGHIGLQVHAIRGNKDAGKKIMWRNIKIISETPEKYTWPESNIRQVNYLLNTLSEKEKQNGWQLLWDGKTTYGWRGAKTEEFPKKGWHIDNGILSVEESGGGESEFGGDIITAKQYRNFILEVDFNISEGANSGIKYFVRPDLNKGEGSAIGCEFQILDDKNHPDAKMGIDGNRTLGSLYDLIPAEGTIFNPNLAKKRFNGINSWNRARIEVRGNIVAHYLNGSKIIEYNRGSQMWKALVAYSKYAKWPKFGEYETGNILLQDHGDEVLYRNIKIKELPADL